MKFCPDHWAKLRATITELGLDSLVAESGEQAAKNLASEANEGSTIDNFDPLMGAHNAIVAQAMDLIKARYQQNPLMLMANEGDPEVTWPTCPICALNWCHEEHDRICTKEGCDYPKAFDWTDEMVNGASDHMLATWREMKA